jgi:hypothetical protein
MTPTANPVTQAAFDAAYWASFPPAVAALQSMQVDVEISPAPPNGRTQTAINLAKQGFVIDTETMVYGWGPYLMMSDRQAFGFTWVPSLLQAPPTIAPGVNDPGVAAYNPNNPPAGSIKVSTNLADYPPYATPAPVPTVTDLVGAQILAGVNQYFAVYGDTSPAGTDFTDARGKFQKFASVINEPMGSHVWYYWELLTPAAA